jgi:hypothetical protein
MVGNFEPENLRGAKQQNGFRARCIGGKSALEKAADDVPQRAESSKHGRNQPAHESAVAVGQGGDAGMGALAGQLLVEGQLPAQHTIDDIGGDAASSETGDLGLGSYARARHA